MRGRLLVVGTDDTTQATFAAAFADGPVEVVIAPDASAAEALLREGAFDAVIADGGAPVVRQLRAADSNGGELPVIAVGSREGGDDEVRGLLDAGATDYVVRPVGAVDVFARVGAALRIARAEQDLRAARVELREVSRSDHLTGLANRRHVEEHLAMATSAARRHRQPISCIVVDVDHLRRINDSEGHVAGDDVLRAVAARIVHVLRGEDMAGRWGGEEVLVVAPSTDLDGAWRLGERIREAVSATPIPLSSGRDVLVTVSVGCATGQGDDIDQQIDRAEAALEEAKSTGRNRVVADSTVLG